MAGEEGQDLAVPAVDAIDAHGARIDALGGVLRRPLGGKAPTLAPRHGFEVVVTAVHRHRILAGAVQPLPALVPAVLAGHARGVVAAVVQDLDGIELEPRCALGPGQARAVDGLAHVLGDPVIAEADIDEMADPAPIQVRPQIQDPGLDHRPRGASQHAPPFLVVLPLRTEDLVGIDGEEQGVATDGPGRIEQQALPRRFVEHRRWVVDHRHLGIRQRQLARAVIGTLVADDDVIGPAAGGLQAKIKDPGLVLHWNQADDRGHGAVQVQEVMRAALSRRARAGQDRR